ncbi:MAG: slipin family protein [Chloroflexi bacterium]|nr:slipin family protein [Chloroflexota bacterium]
MLSIAVGLFASAVRVVQEYERGVIFRLGRVMGARGPGWFFLIPLFERMQKVDLRIITMDVPSQEVITKDNVTVKVNAVLYFKVDDPEAVVVRVLDFIRATSQIAQTTLRNVAGQSELDEILAERERINLRLQQIIDEATEPWGVKVTAVLLKDIELPQGMQRAMARQAEAERERRAKIINADGEFQAAERLADAGRVLAEVPTTMQLRFLQTLGEIATERNSTIVFPVPVDLLSVFMGDKGGARSEEQKPRPRNIPVHSGDGPTAGLLGPSDAEPALRTNGDDEAARLSAGPQRDLAGGEDNARAVPPPQEE